MSRIVDNIVDDDNLGHEFKISILTISVVITTFGLFGNSVVMFVISALREYKKSVTHWYVFQLAIADTLFLLSLPFNESQEWSGVWIFSEWMCKIKEAVLYLNCYASILFLMVMSIDRYLAICWSHSPIGGKLRNRKFAYSATAVIWIVCLLLCIPLLMYSYKTGQEPNCKCRYKFPENRDDENNCDEEKNISESFYQLCLSLKNTKPKRCSYPEESPMSDEMYFIDNKYFNITNTLSSNNWSSASGDLNLPISQETENIIVLPAVDNSRLNPLCHYSKGSHYLFAFLYFNFFGLFVVPFAIMVVCYGLIVKRIFVARVRTNTPVSTSFTQTTASRRSSRSRSYSRADQDRLRVTIMCAALVSSFVFCWLPYHALQLAKIAGINDTAPLICRNILKLGTFFGYLNSALNPYLYSFLGTQFLRRLSLACSSLGNLFVRRRISSTGGSFAFKQKNGGSKNISNNDKKKLNKFQRTKMSSKNIGSYSQQNVSQYDTRCFQTEAQGELSPNIETNLNNKP